ncbi:hypothetical protein GCM10008985_22210 [Halococcus dombrowskii]|uniref:Uncharacterized protein n=1 Tax=Halococcus dombrowskii TaxID=179637 RepID=A0AAV3SJ62_HALDO
MEFNHCADHSPQRVRPDRNELLGKILTLSGKQSFRSYIEEDVQFSTNPTKSVERIVENDVS